MFLACDIDCGEAFPGHRLVARGLRDDGYSNDSLYADYMGHSEARKVHRVVSLVYALVPGLADPGRNTGQEVDARVVLDPPADPAEGGSVLDLGGERDGRPGGNETEGAFGPFVLPEGTQRVIVEFSEIRLIPVDSATATEAYPRRQIGTLELEITSGTANWSPTQGS